VFVESIIAAAIVAMSLAAMFRSVADSANRNRMVESRRAAVLVAQSELAAFGTGTPLRPGQSTGLVGEMVWRADVSPAGDGAGASAVGGLWRVAVSVRSKTDYADLVRLETLRLGPQA